jgi:hypothetical protein
MKNGDIRSLATEPHHPQVLRCGHETRAIAIRLPSGEQHRVHERAYLLVADGEIEISQDGNSVTGDTGFLSPFEPNERRTVRALSDTRLVLGSRSRAGQGWAHPESRTPTPTAERAGPICCYRRPLRAGALGFEQLASASRDGNDQ